MIKERAMELVAALRSGKYKQGFDQLRLRDAFCCLGVACDISGIGQWVREEQYDCAGDCRIGALPTSVQDYFGFRTCEGEIYGGPSLAHLNDEERKSFAEIADVIEANWEKL